MKKYLVFMLVAISLASCTPKEQKAAETPIVVKTTIISSESYSNSSNYLATIEPETKSGLSFQVSGNVEAVYVSEGQFVKKGALLARLSGGHLSNAYSSAKAEYNQVRDAYTRMKQLYKNSSLAEIKFVEIQSKLEQAKAQLQSAQKDISDCNLRAPFDGVIDKKMIEIGVNVSQGIPVLNLMKISSVNAKISIPEKNISNIQVGQWAEINIPVLNKTFTGKISEKNLASDNLSQTYDVKVKLANPHNELLSGMVGNVHLQEASAPKVITLPAEVVQLLANDQPFVWVVDNTSKVHLRNVKIGEQTADGIQIISGLSKGDKVVTDGYQKLSEGLIVKAL